MPSEKPILFSGPLVRAILADEKTQTRRLLRPKARAVLHMPGAWDGVRASDEAMERVAHPVGTLLWVRETWRARRALGPNAWDVRYEADGATSGALYPPGAWVPPAVVIRDKCAPSIFMPRWASRITLRVTAVRLERLQDITDADICAEGIVHAGFVAEGQSLRDAWATGWDGINSGRDKPERPTTWARNPWVIVYDFERVGVAS